MVYDAFLEIRDLALPSEPFLQGKAQSVQNVPAVRTVNRTVLQCCLQVIDTFAERRIVVGVLVLIPSLFGRVDCPVERLIRLRSSTLEYG